MMRRIPGGRIPRVSLPAAFAAAALLVSAAASTAAAPPADDTDLVGRIAAAREARAILFRDARLPLLDAGLAAGQEDVDALDYDLSLRLDFTAEQIHGTCIGTFRTLVSGLASVPLHFYDDMTVAEVRVDGASASYTRAANILTVAVAPPRVAGDTLAVTVVYSGHPYRGGFGSFTWTTHEGAPIAATLSEPSWARTWWPCKDVPSDKATATVRVTAAEGNVCAGNGTLLGIVSNGDGTTTYTWRESYPIATYLVSLAVTNYQVFDDLYVSASGDTMPLHYFAYPEKHAEAVEDFSVTPAMIGVFASMFGEYPFLEEQYGMAMIPFGGAMEHQTMTSYGAGLVRGDHAYDWVVAHELAHQWWGDLVTPLEWADVWLNEGFASYSEALWAESVGGAGEYRYVMSTMDHDFSGPLYDPESLFSGTVYDKGAWVVHMIRGLLGDEDFFAVLRSHAAGSAYGNVSTAGFKATCESVCGQDLDWFFEEWVYEDWGRPDYRWAWGVRPGTNGPVVQVTVRQVQTGPAFRMPLPVALISAAGDTAWHVLDDFLASQEFEIEVAEAPFALAFDPHNWVLKYASSVNNVPDPGSGIRAVLGPVYPSPGGGLQSVPYSVAVSGPVSLEVYDVSGRLVKTLFDGESGVGDFTAVWDGRRADGRPAPSGVYVARLSGDGVELNRKFVVLP